MKKKLSLNKIKIASMDESMMRSIRGGGTWDGWSTYENGCTDDTFLPHGTLGDDCTTNPNYSKQDCTEGDCSRECSDANCLSYPDGCLTPTLGCTDWSKCHCELTTGTKC